MDPLDVRPLTPERWSDLEQLFGDNGAYAGCWCMWWRCTRREFERCQGEGNRMALRRLVDSGLVPGVLGFEDGRPVAWCAVGDRGVFSSLERSPVLKRLDDRPVWSIVCLFVKRERRGRNLAQKIIRGACEYARGKGATIIEAYPTVPRKARLAPVSSFMGTPDLFARAGFRAVARPSQARLVMRLVLDDVFAAKEPEG